jgi:hypothetical protein
MIDPRMSQESLTIQRLGTEWQAIWVAPPPRAACHRLAACELAIANALRQRRSTIAQLVAWSSPTRACRGQ